jgi:hypothetical protein
VSAGYRTTRVLSASLWSGGDRVPRDPGFPIACLHAGDIGTRSALQTAVTFQIKIGKFGDDDSADISVDGRVVGWLERVRGERFASASSRARVTFVSHYSIMLTDDAANAQLAKHDVGTRAEAKLEVERAFDRAWSTLATTPAITE